MAALSRSQLRQLKKAAKEFARRARPGTTYYVVDHVDGIKSGRRVAEIQFKKKSLVGLMWGSYSPERLYLATGGAIYEDRNHPAIRRLPTWREYDEAEAKFEAAFLGSQGHYEAVGQIADGTAFRPTW